MDEANRNRAKSAELAYKEVSRSHQAITDFRAKLLGLLPLASGTGILLLLGDSADRPPPANLLVIGMFGFAVTFGLFMYEIRGIQQCRRLRCQAAILEERLEFPEKAGPFRDRTHERLCGFVGAEGAGWIVYTAVMASWLYVAGSGVTLGEARHSLWTHGRGLALAGIYVVVLFVAFAVRCFRKDIEQLRCTRRSSDDRGVDT